MTERGLKNINVFYSTFTNVFFIFVTFFYVFYFFFLERFLHGSGYFLLACSIWVSFTRGWSQKDFQNFLTRRYKGQSAQERYGPKGLSCCLQEGEARIASGMPLASRSTPRNSRSAARQQTLMFVNFVSCLDRVNVCLKIPTLAYVYAQHLIKEYAYVYIFICRINVSDWRQYYLIVLVVVFYVALVQWNSE